MIVITAKESQKNILSDMIRRCYNAILFIVSNTIDVLI